MPARFSWARSALSWEQRYQFLSGWLPWISDGLGMVVTLMALVWTCLMWALPTYIDVPMPALVGGGDGAVRHQAVQDPAALSAQGAAPASRAR